MQGGGQERSVFSQFCNVPAPPFMAEKIHSCLFNDIKQNTDQEWKTMSPKYYQSLNAGGPLSSTAKSSSFKPGNFSNFGKFSLNRLGDKDDIRDPSSAQLGITPRFSNSKHSKDRKYELKKGSGVGDLNSRSHVM